MTSGFMQEEIMRLEVIKSFLDFCTIEGRLGTSFEWIEFRFTFL